MAERRAPAARRLAFLGRLGDAARGLVYVAMGFLAARAALATRAGSAAGPDEALRWVIREPHGPLVVALVAGGLFADALFRAIDAFTRRSVSGRIAAAARALGALLLGATALRVGRNVRRTGAPVLRSAVSWLLDRSWGPRALVAAGAAAGIVALLEIVQGATGRLKDRLPKGALSRRPRRWAEAIARAGIAAHGALVGAIALYLVRAGTEADPRDVVDSGGALRRLERLPFGPGLLAAIAAGLVAYGLSRWVLAVYRRE
ncbi:MAG TPA: DUF1206 domain-containing protein [Thermoanaerobaculia bacterium]|nr:DUF1206 domain-containing protein [Thermoanaerobaculia bacterium]